MTERDRGAGATTPAPSLIVAQVGEEPAEDLVHRAALSLATEAHARLVLYDADAASLLSEPLPSNWAGEGAEEEFGDLLSPDELTVLGRPELRDLVVEARSHGLDAYGWLAGGHGVDSITEYAERIAADLILVPESALERGPLALGEEDVLEAAHEIPRRVRVGVVHRDGTIDYRAA